MEKCLSYYLRLACLLLSVFLPIFLTQALSRPLQPPRLESEGPIGNVACDFEGDKKLLADTFCKAFKKIKSCSAVDQLERELIAECCLCFNTCCTPEGNESLEVEETLDSGSPSVIFPGPLQSEKQTNKRFSDVIKTRNRKVSNTTTNSEKMMNGKEKGNNKIDVTRIVISVTKTVGDGNSTSSNESLSFTTSINGTNSTDSEKIESNEDPCLEFTSGASKSQVSSTKDIPKGLNCTEPHALDEFFPVKQQATTKKRSKRSKHFRIIPTGQREFEYSSGEPRINSRKSSTKFIEDFGDVVSVKAGKGYRKEEIESEDPMWDIEDIPEKVMKKEMTSDMKSTPMPIFSATFSPIERPGTCRILSDTCISLGPDSLNCSKDTDCPGSKKCCFYGCKPYQNLGVCQIPVFF